MKKYSEQTWYEKVIWHIYDKALLVLLVVVYVFWLCKRVLTGDRP